MSGNPTIDDLVGELARIRSRGGIPLFHGTGRRFERFGIDPARCGPYPNSPLGIHLSSDPFVALDYAGIGGGDGAVLLVEVPRGTFGLIGDRDAYIDMTGEDLRKILGQGPKLSGLVADELGDDLNGAGFIFDPEAVRIVSRMDASLVREDLDRDIAGQGSRLLAALCEHPPWDGAEWVAIDWPVPEAGDCEMDGCC